LIETINMGAWLDRGEALARLGVRAQTLYAYVSRGRVGMRPDPADSRRSLYSAQDVDAIARRRARGRRPAAIAESAIAWGEPAISTSISTVIHGRPVYRGEDAVALSERATVEEVAALLWDVQGPVRLAPPSRSADATGGGPFAALAALAAAAPLGA
jgi:citrate synthase